MYTVTQHNTNLKTLQHFLVTTWPHAQGIQFIQMHGSDGTHTKYIKESSKPKLIAYP